MRTLRSGWLITFLAFIALLSLTACGGGGGSAASSSPTTISGVAATGAPIAGTVTLKDRNGLLSGPVPTDSQGNFSIDAADLTPPFILKAEWTEGTQTQTLYSAAMHTGDTHINPLTNLALALATGLDPATVFGASDAAPNASRISDASLTSAVGQIKTLITPLLNDYGISNFDPLNGAYAANPENRLDAMLDVIDIKTENGQVTIGNRLTGAELATGNVTNPGMITLNSDSTKYPSAAVRNDIRDITARIGALGTVIKSGAALTAQNLDAFYIADPNYGTSSGHTRSQDITSTVALFGPSGTNTNGALKDIRNLRIVRDISAAYAGRGVSKAYILSYDFIYENGQIVRGSNVTFGKEAASGLWKFIGDPTGGAAGNNYGGIWGKMVDPGDPISMIGLKENLAEGVFIMQGASGSYSIMINRDSDITLTDTLLTIGDEPPITLNYDIAAAMIICGASTNVLDVSGWTGTVTILASNGNDTVIGNGDNTTLVGENAGTIWTITGTNAGTLTSTGGTSSFTAVGGITGGSGNDSFVMASNVATFNGAIAGGGGTDTLAATAGTNVWAVTGTNAGTLNTTTKFSAIKTLTGGGGTDAIAVVRDANITLTDTSLTVGNEQLNLNGIKSAVLTGGSSSNAINVGAWTGTATIAANGADKVIGNGSKTTLKGQATTNAWTLTAANNGTLVSGNTTTTFISVGNLVGGTSADRLIGLTGSTYTVIGTNAVVLTTAEF